MVYDTQLDTSTIETGAAGVAAVQHTDATPILSVLRVGNFRLLWIGQGLSLLGDQFYMIALPWLVLQVTGSALAMGTVLAAAAVPRALFMLLGGAVTDRFSPRAVMLASDLLRLGLVVVLAGLVLTGLIAPWMLYIIAILFGLVDAFFYPAQGAVVPQLVETEQLQAANMLTQGTAQLSVFVGPVAAGALIALLDAHRAHTAATGAGTQGLVLAFGIDALSFLVSALTLWLIAIPPRHVPAGEAQPAGSMLASIREGLVSVWRDAQVRTFFIIIAATNLLVNGPFEVGIPVLARTRFAEGAVAFGLIVSAFGGGALLGTVLAGVLPKPAPQRTGPRLLVVISVVGIGVALMGVISSTAIATVIALVMGTANGYVMVLFITWLQARTPQAMLGRMMSLLMLAAVGLSPISNAGAGALSGLSVTALFIGAGSVMTVIVLLSALNPAVREDEPRYAPLPDSAPES